MKRITESNLRSMVRQELKKLMEGPYDSERYGLSIEFGDYTCEEMQNAIASIQQSKEGQSYPGALDGYSKEEVIQFLNDRISRRCK